MRSPFSPLFFLLFTGLLLWLVFSINLGLITLTFEKLGLDAHSALLLLVTSLFGSAINLPLFSMTAVPQDAAASRPYYGLLRRSGLPFTGRVLIAVNVGGCLVPVFFSAYLLRQAELPPLHVVGATGAVAAVSYALSRPIDGIGIGMPILVAPVSAALMAMLLGGEHRAALAYVAGSLGVLIGADLLRLADVRAMNAPVAAIGGAGTFDGIFITGLVAVLLS